MKTTLQIDDHLMRRAKIRAAEQNRRLRDIVEEGLRLLLDGPVSAQEPELEGVAEDESPYCVNELGLTVRRCHPGDKTVITNAFIDQLRDELGEG